MKSGVYPDEKVISLDNTALNLFRACPSRFLHRIENDLVPLSEANSAVPPLKLHYGTAWHSAMDALYETGLDAAYAAFEKAAAGLEQDPYNRLSIGRGIKDLTEYAERYEAELKILELVENEAIVSSELRGGVTAPDGANWKVVYHGAIDKIFKLRDQIRVRDHKTTSYVSNGTQIQYMLSNQMMGYAYIVQQFYGYEELTIDVDIVGVTKVNPPSTYLRQDIKATPVLMNEWCSEILATASMMLQCHFTGIWPRWGERPCFMYNRRCDFFGICTADKNFRQAQMDAHYSVVPWDPEARREIEAS